MNVVELITTLQALVTNYPKSADMQVTHEGLCVSGDARLCVDALVVDCGRVILCDATGALAGELYAMPRTTIATASGMQAEIAEVMRDDTSRDRMRVGDAREFAEDALGEDEGR